MDTYATVILLLQLFAIGTTEVTFENVGIIGGHSVSIKDFPYMASLRIGGIHHWCGASIIHEQFVLTAAHCILPGRKYTVVVGTDNIYHGGKSYDIEKITVHENYGSITHENDICIIKLSKAIEFGANVSKIVLHEDTKTIKKGTIMNVAGWGNTKPSGSVSETLQEVSVPAVTKGACKKAYRLSFVKITSKMLCAGGKGRDSCQGDSGGPLTLNGVQVGVVSYGGVCGVNPGVYTKVAAYKDWIANKIQEN